MSRPLLVKVYLVHERNNLPKKGEASSRVVAARLTAAAAQRIVDRRPGTWVEKHFAIKDAVPEGFTESPSGDVRPIPKAAR